MDNRPIGFFDSGLGGLTCIPFLQRRLPNESIVYYGDTARTPYGSKSAQTIEKFAFQISDYLIKNDVKMIVIACNTISATCLDSLRERHPDIPVVGIIDPMADRIASESSRTSIGVIGTKVTIASGAYARLISSRAGDLDVYAKACPIFVPLIEEGIIDDEIMDMSIRRYLDDFIQEHDLETLVLGCTHYPLIMKNLHRLYPGLELLNPSEEVVNRVAHILKENDIFAASKEHEDKCFASDLSENFMNMIDKVFEDSQNVKVQFKTFSTE